MASSIIGGVQFPWGETSGVLSVNDGFGGTLINPSGITAGVNIVVGRAKRPFTITNVRGCRVGGTGATVNSRIAGSSTNLSSDLSLTSANTWMDGGAVQNINVNTGDMLEIMLVSVTGSPTQIAIEVDATLA